MAKVVFSLFLIISGIIHPESAFYTPTRGLFISEIGKFNQKDGKIIHVKSLRNPKTNVILSGLKDPKGITIYKNKLWIADVYRLVSLNLDTSRVSIIEGSSFSPQPSFLNDVCQVGNAILVSDTRKNIVYRVEKNRATKMFLVTAPNGIAYSSTLRTTYIATFTKPGRIFSIRGNTANELYASTLINGTDGITLWKQEEILFVSGFVAGNVLAISLRNRRILGSIQGLFNPADIYFNDRRMLLFVPEMGKNRVLIYKVRTKGN